MINFDNIRGDSIEGQRSIFEQLICHLANLDKGGGECRRIDGSGGDGGVEALRILPSGRKVGYQAKYYSSRDKIDWIKIDNSVKTALKQHPELERYVIAIACDFTGKRNARGGSTEGVWGKWDSYVNQWEKLASNGIAIEFESWTAFEIESRLLKPEAEHLIKYFFSGKIFSREWMNRHLVRTINDLQARYSPGEHVDTKALMPFDAIYRRDNICQHLQTIFDLARQSNPRAAASLIENLEINNADIIVVEDTLKSFLAQREAVNWPIEQSWPINEWNTSWYSMTRRLSDLTRSLNNKIRGENSSDTDSLRDRIWEISKVNYLIRPEVFAGHWAGLLNIDLSRTALFVGRAGAGKSHILARGVETAWNKGAPVIHILGQHILDDDPRVSIRKRLELETWSFHELLTALNLMAESAGTRAMLVIDALNEGRGIEVWQNHLSSFIQEVNMHDRVFLVLSCREEYLNYVVPPELIANLHPYSDDNGELSGDSAPLGKLVSVTVDGFSTMEEREAALRKFMDEKGIARPTAPVLDAEFFNPLFMTSVCRSMAKAGINVFPRGLHGARDIFDFVLATKAKSLGTRFDSQQGVHDILRAVLMDLAGIMVARKEDKVSLPDALDAVNSAFKAYPLTDRTWLEVLEGSDILRRDVEGGAVGTWSKPNEVIRFSFQRLQDNLIAEWLIGDCQHIDSAFVLSGPFSFLINRSIRKSDGVHLVRPSSRWAGVLGALWAAVAEKHSKELWHLQSFFGSSDAEFYPNDFSKVFHSSIRERSGSAFTLQTKEILDRLWEEDPQEKLAILLSTSCVPGHKWNADYIVDRFLEMSLPDRDAAWSQWFTHEQSKLVDRAMEITDWALNVDAKRADLEVTRLAGIILACLLAVTHRTLRDRATKGLVNLLIGHPTLFLVLMEKFNTIDDPYVKERLLSAGYGAMCLDPVDVRIKATAEAVIKAFFNGARPPIHLSIRDLACSIIERASERDLVPISFNLTEVVPPFGSNPPALDCDEDDIKQIATVAGDNSIAWSCQRPHDFFKSVISSAVRAFTETSLDAPPPLTQDERAQAFEKNVRSVNEDIEAKLDELLLAVEAERKEAVLSVNITEAPFSILMSSSEPKETTKDTIRKLEKSFVDSLPETLKAAYPLEFAPKIHRQFERPKNRAPEPAGFWIARRAYGLGWTKSRFPNEPYSGDRNRPTIERISEKYQWIALEEFLARLADNFWVKDEYGKGTRPYKARQDVWRREYIDPTILSPRSETKITSSVFIGPPYLTINEVEDSKLVKWPFLEDHFENPAPWLTGKLNDRLWLVAEWSESVNEERKGNSLMDPFRRQIQSFISLVAHNAGERQQVVDGFLGNQSGGVIGWSLKTEAEGYFAHEIKLLSLDTIPFWKSSDYCDVKLASPLVSGSIGNDTDRSIDDYVRYLLPHPRLREALRLDIPNPRDTTVWQLPDGKVFLRQLEDRGEPIILDKESFDSWCQSEGLEYTWIFIGERTARLDERNGKWRRTFGAAWLEDGEVRFKRESRDES
ncbi:MAG: hypothetical protein HXX17_02675 [Geobacteraceae bacterium]|nr:hypothetical protein [Geobacteraceae bacterium]